MRSWVRLAILAAALSPSACRQEQTVSVEGDVALNFEVATPADAPPFVHGTTNLPPGTLLVVALDEARPAGLVREAECYVNEDRSFRSGPLGENGPVPPGVYDITVVMPLAYSQPDEVREAIGLRGERLSGPLVREGAFGASVNSEQRVTIGGPDAVEQQKIRAARDAVRLEQLWNDVETRYDELDQAIDLLTEGVRPTEFPPWQEFSAPFVERLRELDDRLTEAEKTSSLLRLRETFQNVVEMHLAVERGDASGYRKERNTFDSHRREVAESIARLKEWVAAG